VYVGVQAETRNDGTTTAAFKLSPDTPRLGGGRITFKAVLRPYNPVRATNPASMFATKKEWTESARHLAAGVDIKIQCS